MNLLRSNTEDHQSIDHTYRTIAFGTGYVCTACHTNDTSVLGSAGTGSLLNQNDINILHRPPTGDECSLCHYYAGGGNPVPSTVNDAIIDGVNRTTEASCVICHDYNQTGHP